MDRRWERNEALRGTARSRSAESVLSRASRRKQGSRGTFHQETDVISFVRFPAGATITTDKTGIEHLVVVVKGTFQIPISGALVEASTQMGLKFSDEHYGDLASSSVRYENDFDPFKPMCDLVVNGSAHSRPGRRAIALTARLEYGPLRKSVRVVGDRTWQSHWGLPATASRPKPFTSMPIVWERSFGGFDTSPKNPRKHAFDTRNLLGVGLHSKAGRRGVVGARLPNIEEPRRPVRSWRSRRVPVGFGFLPRSSSWRMKYAGTYDEAWLEKRFPFLPDDFDERYHNGRSPDQVVPYPAGASSCDRELHSGGQLEFRIPRIPPPPVKVRFRDDWASMEGRWTRSSSNPDDRG